MGKRVKESERERDRTRQTGKHNLYSRAEIFKAVEEGLFSVALSSSSLRVVLVATLIKFFLFKKSFLFPANMEQQFLTFELGIN